MTYSAVVTTGIYCRPGCNARPNPENVRPFELAAAAEAAGFRACLRCRPYRTDQPVTWVGPELMCRAVQLVADGVLDHGAEADLGALLGVSARHLRRVFVEHLGVTPDQLARSRRAHFARRLLDDTDLSITDVAFASGFGSVRQLQRACVEVFHAPPRELRARRRATDRLVADGGLSLRLAFDGPLAWEPTLAYLSKRAITGVEHVADGVYRRTIVVDGDPGLLELERGGDHHLVLRAHLPHWEGLIHVVEQARRIFALDADPTPAVAHLGTDRLLRRLVRDRPDLRVPGTWDPFELGVRAILGQQVTVARASSLAGALVERFGTPVEGLTAFGLTHTFPSAEILADTDLADLRSIGLGQARAGAIGAFARAVDDGELGLRRGLGLDALTSSIEAEPGLGPWTAHYVALRIGEPDAFPAGDVGLLRSASRLAGVELTTAALAERAERWRPWRALAAFHLWSAETADAQRDRPARTSAA